ncbi:MAG: MBL fold metallo-hydrolase [Oligoflexales bacterium]|nr:MBL fold metallo-hydrolase [Oligoflexales bacterium]
MKLKFWGTRGIMSTPQESHITYGVNTTCIEILSDDRIILVDAGFGACRLGETLEKRLMKKEELTIDIFFTHFHWDHIQGFALFPPLYFKSSIINIYSPCPVDYVYRHLNILFDHSYSPFNGLKNMFSKLNYHQVADTAELGSIQVSFCQTDHIKNSSDKREGNTYGYKFVNEKTREKISIITDHEAKPSAINDKIIEFCENSNILVHDAQYTENEYKNFEGWGHSSDLMALSNAMRIKPRICLLTHHLPNRSDNEINKNYNSIKSKFEQSGLDFSFAKEEYIYCALQTGKLCECYHL